MNTTTSIYTRQEVAKLLNIQEKTVYNYALEGKIIAAPNPYRIRREAVYSKDSVDRYLETIKDQMKVDGYTLQEASNELGISRQHINILVDKHNINIIKNSKVRGGRPKTIIPQESFELLKEITTPSKTKTIKLAKHNYYSSELDIAIYQRFEDGNGDIYRVNKEDKVWGFSKIIDKTFIPYDVAMKIMKLERNYQIHRPLINHIGYAKLRIPSNALEYVDFFYENLGVDNMYVESDTDDNSILLHLRQSVISLANLNLNPSINFNILKQYFLMDGDIVRMENELFIISSQRRLNAVISLDNYNKLHALTTEKQNVSAVLNQILSTYFKM